MLVSICGDPGGAHAVAPVLHLLQEEGRFDLAPYAYNQGLEILSRRGIPCRPLPPQIDGDWTRRRLEEDRPRLILTGTSHNGRDCEKVFIQTARRLGVPSLAVLDFWSNYVVRFSDEQGTLAALPDLVAVMDQRARSDLIAAGIPADTILVTGQPAYDSLRESREAFSPERRLELRKGLGLAANDRWIVFASQPFSTLYPDPQSPTYPGYDEHLVLAELIRALEGLAGTCPGGLLLQVRPHPREKVADLARHRSGGIRLLVSADGDARELAMAADLVVGMNSAFLVEACYLGAVVLSLQPGLRVADPLPTNSWHASRAVYRREEIGTALRELLLDDGARQAARSRAAALELDGQAARRVVDRIYAKLPALPPGMDPVAGPPS
ncbi:MAG TPA: hypothetical protein VKW04_16210 [Planctomycetota bacterium]|nr:hypothetical protein [Planctomycetota bacterium]